MFPYFEISLIFLNALYIWETYLDWRQHQKLKITKFPPELKGIVDEELFLKSQLYGLDKSKFNFVKSAFHHFLYMVVLTLSVQSWFWDLAEGTLYYLPFLPKTEMVISIFFALLYGLASKLINVPWSLYLIFVVEEKHGFNKTTLRTFVTDFFKSLLLTAVLGIPFLMAFIFIIEWGGDRFYIYVWFFTFLFQLFLITIYPIFIQPLFNKVEPLPEGSLRIKIEALATRTGFPLKKILTMDGSKRSSHSNAYFYGFWNNKHIVLYDTLIKQCNEEEIIAIIGHEMGHYFKSHLMINLSMVQVHLFIAFFLFAKLIHNKDLFISFGFTEQGTPTLLGFLFFLALYNPVERVVVFLLHMLSRRNEFQADAFAANLGFGKDLSSGLVTLHKENKSNLVHDTLYSIYHYSHPHLLQRIEAIKKIDEKNQ